MSNSMRKTLSLIGVVGMLAAVSTQSFAATEFQKEHPRRAEVNHRLDNQDKRIHQEVKEGKMSKAEAKNLHKEDHQIRKEEKSMASQNGGHITKLEQKTLNQQENGVSKQIGK